jgi:phospholipid/cholesterol/gamma-HCH transport system ATP-binding protein
VIEFRGIHKAFGGRPVLRGLDLTVRTGETLFIVGTSGVGKSVTIKHVGGFLRPDRGEVLLDGERVDHLPERALYPVRRKVAMVFQHATLFDSMTLGENVALPLRTLLGLSAAEATRRAHELLARVHLAELAGAYPTELGDGTRKRAAIARALALAPRCILFDEPTTGLDPVSARRIDALIRELGAGGVTSVVVSHDLVSIRTVADRVALLYRGVVHALGTPDELAKSPDPVVQQFLAGRSTGPMETPGF